MRRTKWIKWTGISAALLIATTVMAQESPEADVSYDNKGSNLSGDEQVVQAENYISKMKETQSSVERLANKARGDKDIIKLNCVNDKLIQIKGHLNLGERTRDSLKTAVARQDEAARNHSFAKLTITYQKVIVLSQEAEACIGEDITFVGATRVDVEIDKDIPIEDPAGAGTVPTVAGNGQSGQGSSANLGSGVLGGGEAGGLGGGLGGSGFGGGGTNNGGGTTDFVEPPVASPYK